jgi:hypothetical protein
MLAPIFADWMRPLYGANNASTGEMVKKWSKVADHIDWWLYSANFSGYLEGFNSFEPMQGNYKYIASHGAEMLLDEGQADQRVCTAFNGLKQYLESKLAWDVNLDTGSLTYRYFECVFGPGADAMRDMYDRMRYYLRIVDEKDYAGIYESQSRFAQVVGKDGLDYMMSCVDRAYEAIEPLRAADPAAYALYGRSVKLESLMPRYQLINIYAGTFGGDKLLEMKLSFKKDATALNVSNVQEHIPIDTVWTKWGIA